MKRSRFLVAQFSLAALCSVILSCDKNGNKNSHEKTPQGTPQPASDKSPFIPAATPIPIQDRELRWADVELLNARTTNDEGADLKPVDGDLFFTSSEVIIHLKPMRTDAESTAEKKIVDFANEIIKDEKQKHVFIILPSSVEGQSAVVSIAVPSSFPEFEFSGSRLGDFKSSLWGNRTNVYVAKVMKSKDSKEFDQVAPLTTSDYAAFRLAFSKSQIKRQGKSVYLGEFNGTKQKQTWRRLPPSTRVKDVQGVLNNQQIPLKVTREHMVP